MSLEPCQCGQCRWCTNCDEHLCDEGHRWCGHCYTEYEREQEILSDVEAEARHAKLDAAEQHETACPSCKGGPCRNALCEDCAEAEHADEREHESAHRPGRL